MTQDGAHGVAGAADPPAARPAAALAATPAAPPAVAIGPAGSGTAPIDTAHPRTWLKQVLPRGLFGRSMLIIVTPLILVQIVTTYVFFERHWSTLSRRLADGLIGDVQVLTDLSIDFPGRRSYFYGKVAAAMQLEARFEPDARLPVAAPDDSDSFLGSILGPPMARRLRRPFRLSLSMLARDAFIDVQLDDGILHIVAPRERLFNTAMYLFLFWMVGTSLVLFTIAMMFMRNQVRAVRRLAAAADSLGKGRDVLDFRPEGATEVRQAAAAFVSMRERIRRHVNQRTTMLAGVSHDLRTPLTRMKLSLEMLGNGPDIDGLKADVDEMEQMIDGYLAFARGEGAETATPTDMAVLLQDLAEDMRRGETGGQQRISLDMMLGALPVMPVRPQAVRRCLANLLSNAHRHAAGRVTLRAAVDAETAATAGVVVEILIDDDGPGIPADRRTAVFEPFYRLDPSRNPETGGVGLGLTIARDVVRTHGGEITLEESPLGGLRVRLRLPL